MDITQISRAFYMMHDGDISKIEHQHNDIIISIYIPYLAELIELGHKYIYFKLINCSELYFKLWGNGDAKFNVDDINKIELEIKKAGTDGQYVIISCLTDDINLVGGDLFVRLEDLQIYDENGSEKSLETLEVIAKEYWNRFRS